MTKEEQDRILRLELKHENVFEKLNNIEINLKKLNENVSNFTQELVLLKSNNHIPSECRTDILKEFNILQQLEAITEKDMGREEKYNTLLAHINQVKLDIPKPEEE